MPHPPHNSNDTHPETLVPDEDRFRYLARQKKITADSIADIASLKLHPTITHDDPGVTLALAVAADHDDHLARTNLIIYIIDKFKAADTIHPVTNIAFDNPEWMGNTSDEFREYFKKSTIEGLSKTVTDDPAPKPRSLLRRLMPALMIAIVGIVIKLGGGLEKGEPEISTALQKSTPQKSLPAVKTDPSATPKRPADDRSSIVVTKTKDGAYDIRMPLSFLKDVPEEKINEFFKLASTKVSENKPFPLGLKDKKNTDTVTVRSDRLGEAGAFVNEANSIEQPAIRENFWMDPQGGIQYDSIP